MSSLAHPDGRLHIDVPGGPHPFGRSANGSRKSAATTAGGAFQTMVRLPRSGWMAVPLLVMPLLMSCGKSVAKTDSRPNVTASSTIAVTVGRVESVVRDRTLRVVGTLYAKDEATIGAEVEGRVEKTMVDFGDRVKTRHVLAEIDTASYQALANQSSANVAKARANYANAEQNRKRTIELSKNNIAAASDLDRAVAEADQAHAALEAAEAELAIARLNVAKSRVIAPWDGVVADRIATAGDYVKVGAPLFRILNDSVFKYIVQAPEAYAGLIRKEQPVQLEIDAYPGEKFEGRVYLISPQVNVTTRGFAFGALVQNPDFRLKANSFARGEVILERGVPTLVVPLEAVVTFSGISKVFVIEHDTVHVRQVQPGRIRERRQEVLSGLKVAETVVLSGQSKLYEGAKVHVKGSESDHAENSPNSPDDPTQAALTSASHH